VSTAQAIPCGLILNELLTNSLKHAFRGERSGEVRVGLLANLHGAIRLRVSDDGVGLPADFHTRSSGSLGMQLVTDLAKQLLGRFEVAPGPSFTVTFPAGPEAAPPGEVPTGALW